MKKQSKETPVAIVNHDFEENVLTIKFRDGTGKQSQYHEGRIIIESDKDGPLKVIIVPFDI